MTTAQVASLHSVYLFFSLLFIYAKGFYSLLQYYVILFTPVPVVG